MQTSLLDLVGEHHLGACDTEREAAALVTPRVPKQALDVLATIACSEGLAGWEICDRTMMLRGSVSRSLTQLKNKGFIKVAGKKVDLMEAPARIWVATEAGRDYLTQDPGSPLLVGPTRYEAPGPGSPSEAS